MTATIPPPDSEAEQPSAPEPPEPGRPESTKEYVDRLRGYAAHAWEALRHSNEQLTPTNRALAWALGVFALLTLWVLFFGLVLSGLVESHEQNNLYDRYRGELAAGTAPLGGPIARGAPVALVNSPDADLSRIVAVEGSSSTELRTGPGHFPGTPLPGQPGVSVIFGRSTSFGAPFGHLADLSKGDKIAVTTGQGKFAYVVDDVRRPGDPLPPVLASGGSRLTLVTAGGGGWRSGWAPQYAMYVDATLQGKAQAVPSGSSVPSARDAALARDTRGLFPLVLWLQLLLVAAIGGIWLFARWGASRAWLLAIPVGLAGLWGASQEAWLLLPNLL